MPLSGFPEAIEVTLGTAWTGQDGLDPSDVIILYKVSGQTYYTEDGTNTPGATNRLKFLPKTIGSYGVMNLFANVSASWLQIGAATTLGDTVYTFLDVWSNHINSTNYGGFTAGFLSASPVAYNPAVFSLVREAVLGGSSEAFTPNSANNYFTVTSDNTKVAEAVGNLVIDLATHAPAGFWSAVSADGGNIRVVNNAGDTAYSYHLEGFDSGAQTGLLYFNCSADIATGSDVTWRIYADTGGLSLPAVTDTLGRNNVWETGAVAVWGMDEDPTSDGGDELLDWTSNGSNLTSYGTMTSGDLVTGDGGKAIEFDGSDDRLSTPSTAGFNSDDWTALARLKMPANAATMQVLNKTSSSVFEWWLRVLSDGTVNTAQSYNSGGATRLYATSTGTVDDDAWHTIGGTVDADTGAYCYIDGSNDGTDETPDNSPYHTTTDAAIGARSDGGQPLAGQVAFVMFFSAVKSANWHLTHHNNLHSNGTFWTAGAWQGSSGAAGPLINGGLINAGLIR